MMVMVSLAWVGATQFLKSTYTGLLRGVVDTGFDPHRWEEFRMRMHRENNMSVEAVMANAAAARAAASVSAAAASLGGSSSNTVQDGSGVAAGPAANAAAGNGTAVRRMSSRVFTC